LEFHFDANKAGIKMSAVFSEFDRLDLWQSNGLPFGHLMLRLNPKKQSRIIFFLLTFSFY